MSHLAGGRAMRPLLICSVAAGPQQGIYKTNRLAAAASTSSNSSIPASDTQIASTIAGVLSRLLLHPMDCIKTRLQFLRSSPSNYVNPGRAIIDFIVAERLAGLYRGILGALAGVIPYSMIYMPSYESAQRRLSVLLDGKQLFGIRHVLAGSIAGLCGSLVKVPVDVIKKRVQAGLYPNVFAAVSSIAKENLSSGFARRVGSISNFYTGWRSSILYDIPYNAVQFTVLENVKRVVQNLKQERPFTQADYVLIGALTGMITSVITEPLDVVKTRMMTQRMNVIGGGNQNVTIYRGWWHCMTRIVSEEGIIALWKGTLPRLVWVGASSAIWYGTYQAVRQTLNDSQEQSPKSKAIVAGDVYPGKSR